MSMLEKLSKGVPPVEDGHLTAMKSFGEELPYTTHVIKENEGAVPDYTYSGGPAVEIESVSTKEAERVAAEEEAERLAAEAVRIENERLAAEAKRIAEAEAARLAEESRLAEELLAKEEAEKANRVVANSSFLGEAVATTQVVNNGRGGVNVQTLLEDLGLSGEQDRKITIINLSPGKFTPLEPVKVEDSEGLVSKTLQHYYELTGQHIIPAEMTNIGDWVVPKHHDVMYQHGVKYFYPKVSKQKIAESEQRINNYVDKVVEELRQGKLYRASLYTDFSFQNNEYRTLQFTMGEIQEIITLLSNYSAKLIEIGGDDLLIVAGDYRV